jgi:[ribosomal protein S5]-alanine N-acetyltransferase
MTTTTLDTKSLKLVLQSPDQTRAFLASLPPHERAEVSPAWLARVEAATEADPWTHGFSVLQRNGDDVIGSAGFKGPPSHGVVEIAYGIAPQHQGRGYATEAAEALSAYALGSGLVRTVRAHTLPEANASVRVLTKCGFRFVGEVSDPEDGRVWRWERTCTAAG